MSYFAIGKRGYEDDFCEEFKTEQELIKFLKDKNNYGDTHTVIVGKEISFDREEKITVTLGI